MTHLTVVLLNLFALQHESSPLQLPVWGTALRMLSDGLSHINTTRLSTVQTESSFQFTSQCVRSKHMMFISDLGDRDMK